MHGPNHPGGNEAGRSTSTLPKGTTQHRKLGNQLLEHRLESVPGTSIRRPHRLRLTEAFDDQVDRAVLEMEPRSSLDSDGPGHSRARAKSSGSDGHGLEPS